jgi:formylglycine-generating enzyme required for sulfatase activity
VSDPERIPFGASPEDEPPAAVVEAFYERYLADRRRGAVADDAVYRSAFPGYESAIDAELAAIRRAAEEAAAPRFGRFRLLRELGRGGQGVVHLAVDQKLGRQVALKVLRGGASRRGEASERFRREIEVTAKLELPGICPVYETGVEGDDLWFTMRYAEGETLAAALARRATNSSVSASSRDADVSTTEADAKEALRAVAFVAAVARVVHAAHERGVVHRDLKPQNLMVSPDGSPLVLDFGLARADDLATPGLTRTGDVFGTPAYMAPEQIRPDLGAVDRRADVFALGCVLYEALAGRRPFVAEGRDALAAAVLRDDPPDLREGRPYVDADLAAVVSKAMEKDRRDRYATAAAFADDLDRVAVGRRAAARAGFFSSAARFARRRPLATRTAVVVCVALAFFAAFRSRRDPLEETRLALDGLIREGERSRPLDPRASSDRAATWRAQAAAAVADLPTFERRLRALRSDLARAAPRDSAEVLGAAAARAARLADVADRLALVGSPRASSAAARAKRAEARAVSAPESDAPAPDYRDAADAALDASIAAAIDALHELQGLVDAYDAESGAARAAAHEATVDRAAWERAARELAADARFGGAPLLRRANLIPLGADPESRLQEFAVVGTGATPVRAADGRLSTDAATAMVVVLLPGGEARTGAREDDAFAAEVEGPLFSVRLDPFFISKFETTQADWLRLIGRESSSFYPAWTSCGRATTFRHPTESATREEAATFAARFGMRLPTEVEWEYAARAGSETPWSYGADKRSLIGAANLADASQAALGREADAWRREAEIDDGWCRHAPVGSFRANAFGLHDVLGNVAEWCADDATFRLDEYAVREGDGRRERGHPFKGVVRGGGWKSDAGGCRVSARRIERVDVRADDVGFRVALSFGP